MSPRSSRQAQVLTNGFGLSVTTGLYLRISDGFTRVIRMSHHVFCWQILPAVVAVQVRVTKRKQLIIEK